MKVELELVKHILKRNALEARKVDTIINDITEEVKMVEAEEPAAPAVKKQFVIIASDPDGHLEGIDLVGWIVQIPEEDSPLAAEERLFRSAYEFNITPKGRRMPVKTVAEVCEHVSPRITKDQQIWIKTKEPVYLLRTGGDIPLGEIARKVRES